MGRRSNRLREQQEAPSAEEQTPVEEVQEEEEIVWLPVSVAIYDEQSSVFKHWAIFVENEQDTSKSFILHVEGSAGRFRYEQKRTNARNSKRLFNIIQVGYVKQDRLRVLRDTVEGVDIKNDDMTWNCQDFVWTALGEIAGAGLIDAEDDLYINGRRNVWSQMEGLA